MLSLITRSGVALGIFASLAAPVLDGLVTYRVTPSDTDPAIKRFNEPHYIVFDSTRGPPADLLVFMTGTGGNPDNVSDFW